MYFKMRRKCCITKIMPNQQKNVEEKTSGRNRKMNQFLLLKRGLLGGTTVLQNNDKHIFDFMLTLYLNLLDVTA